MTDKQTQAAEATRGLARKIIIAAVFGALVFAGMALYSDLPKLKAAATGFAPEAFVLGALLVAGNYALRIVRWQYYLRLLDIRIPWGESALVFLSGLVMSVTPGKVGEVLKSLLLFEARGISPTRTAPIVVAERLTDLIALVLLTAVGCLTFEHGIAIAVSAALVVSLLLLVCAYPPLGHAVLRAGERLPGLSRVAGRLWVAYDSLLAMTRARSLVLATGISCVGWGLECVCMYVIVHGFAGVTMSWDAATFAYAASTIMGALAMMPGGLGVTEVGMAGLVQALGADTITPAVATATTILVRVATLWFAVLVGGVALPAYRTLARRLRTADA